MSGVTTRFNPWRGCTKVSDGCKFCYAEKNMSVKLHGVKWGPHGTRVRLSDAGWKEPEKWNRKAERDGVRRRVFCASLADVFEDWDGAILDHHGNEFFVCDNCLHRETFPATTAIANPDGQPCLGDDTQPGCWMRPLTLDDLRRDLFALIDRTPHLDWLLLTKRPENIWRMWPKLDNQGNVWFWKNVWLGTSIENQPTADLRISHLLECPAAVRFLSAEPLLEPLEIDLTGIDWVIVGGESGPNARPMHIEWARSIVEQCEAAGVPCFVKQLGADVRGNWDEFRFLPNCPMGKELLGVGDFADGAGFADVIKLTHSKGGNLDEWPEDLRVREFPQVELTGAN